MPIHVELSNSDPFPKFRRLWILVIGTDVGILLCTLTTNLLLPLLFPELNSHLFSSFSQLLWIQCFVLIATEMFVVCCHVVVVAVAVFFILLIFFLFSFFFSCLFCLLLCCLFFLLFLVCFFSSCSACVFPFFFSFLYLKVQKKR